MEAASAVLDLAEFKGFDQLLKEQQWLAEHTLDHAETAAFVRLICSEVLAKVLHHESFALQSFWVNATAHPHLVSFPCSVLGIALLHSHLRSRNIVCR